MPRAALPVTTILVALWFEAGCGVQQKAAPEAHPEPSPVAIAPEAPVSTASTGTIRGVVRFRGRAPTMPIIDFSSNPQCEREHPKSVPAETVVINPNRTVRDVFVWIKSGLPPSRWNPPASPARLDQVGCLYQPRVLGLMVNQELVISNSDFVNHDVNIEAARNEASNDAEPPRSETIRRRFHTEEIWFPVSCGVHPWMRSYLAVVSHPFFAVTGTDGNFELRSVPPGEYVIEAIQERFGHQERRVAVTPNQTQVTDFVYSQ